MAEEVATEAGQQEQAPATGDALGEAGKAALAAERKAARDAKKEAADLAARLKEFEDRDKTETQRLTERLEAAERDAAPLRDAQVRSQFILEKIGELETLEQVRAFVGIADRLRGNTLEELSADADVLLPRVLPAVVSEGVGPALRRPVTTLTGGASAAPVSDPGPGQPRISSALAEWMK